jgi:hypothetical protein
MARYVFVFNTICFLLFAGLLMQCHDNSIQTISYSVPDDLTKVIPLKIGNYWMYRSVFCGILNQCDTTLDSIRIIDTLQINGNKCYKYNGIPPHLYMYDDMYFETVNKNDYSIYFCLNCLSGIKGKSLKTADGWMPLHILKTPICKGNQWRIADWDSTDYYHFGVLTIINPDTTIYLEDRAFYHAIYLSKEQGGPPWFTELFIVPGIGVVCKLDGDLDSGVTIVLREWNLH